MLADNGDSKLQQRDDRQDYTVNEKKGEKKQGTLTQAKIKSTREVWGNAVTHTITDKRTTAEVWELMYILREGREDAIWVVYDIILNCSMVTESKRKRKRRESNANPGVNRTEQKETKDIGRTRQMRGKKPEPDRRNSDAKRGGYLLSGMS